MKDIEVSDEYSDVRKIGNKYNIKHLQNAIIDVSLLHLSYNLLERRKWENPHYP